MKQLALLILVACLASSGCAALDAAHFAWCCGSLAKDVLDRVPAHVTTVKTPKPVSVDEKPAMPEEGNDF